MTSGLLWYFARRALLALLLVFVVSSAALVLARLAPGDFTAELVRAGVSPETIARERARYGLDRPVASQYVEWVGRALRFDLGTSIRFGRPVGELVRERARNSAKLAVAALIIGTLGGLSLGVVTGSARGGPLPALIRLLSVLALSLPPLLMSLLLALLAARTGWFPVGGMASLDAEELGSLARAADFAWHLVLPALALALPLAATLERLQAQSLAETLTEPFIRAAEARGVPRARVVWRHALRVAATPVVAVYGILVGSLMSGSFTVEIVTAWPGLGQLLYEALLARDIYLVAGCAAVGSLFLALGTLVSDVLVAFADPRLRDTAGVG